MGYSKFSVNEEDAMDAFMKEKKILKKLVMEDNPKMAESLLRRKMIAVDGEYYVITSRGESAITQQLRSGEYWVAPLKSKPFNMNPVARMSRETARYVH